MVVLVDPVTEQTSVGPEDNIRSVATGYLGDAEKYLRLAISALARSDAPPHVIRFAAEALHDVRNVKDATENDED